MPCTGDGHDERNAVRVIGADGGPLTATVAGGDGTLVTLLGWSMALSIGGMVALVVLRRWRTRRQPVIRSVRALRRVTA